MRLNRIMQCLISLYSVPSIWNEQYWHFGYASSFLLLFLRTSPKKSIFGMSAPSEPSTNQRQYVTSSTWRIPQATIRSRIESMRRCTEVAQARGRHTRYWDVCNDVVLDCIDSWSLVIYILLKKGPIIHLPELEKWALWMHNMTSCYMY